MQERCESCGSETRVVEAYLAVEDGRELEVTRLACRACGLEHESSEPALEVA